MAHNEVHLLQVGHGSVGEGALRLKGLLSNIQLARHLEITVGIRTAVPLPLRGRAGLEGAGEATPGTLGAQRGAAGPWAHLARDLGGALQLHGGDVLGPVPAAGPLWMESV